METYTSLSVYKMNSNLVETMYESEQVQCI